MILEVVENHTTAKDKSLTITPVGTRGILRDAGYASDAPGIADGTEVAVIEVVADDATSEYIMVPLSKLRIVHGGEIHA